ncbi:MAG: hypothetical protein U0521_05405 [Anaerolineae bacterium]
MNREAPFAARIAFRLPQSLYDKLASWADEEDRPLANLIYTLVKQAASEREHALQARELEKDAN